MMIANSGVETIYRLDNEDRGLMLHLEFKRIPVLKYDANVTASVVKLGPKRT